MIVLVDCDGVLSDFVGLIRKKCGVTSEIKEMELRESLTPEEMTCVLRKAQRPGFCLEMEWLPGAKDMLIGLQKDHDVFVVTSPWHSRTWAGERREWLSEAIDPRRVISCPTPAKRLIRGDVLIEDTPAVMHDWLHDHPEGVGYLADVPWNRPGTKTFDEHGTHPRMRRIDASRLSL